MSRGGRLYAMTTLRTDTVSSIRNRTRYGTIPPSPWGTVFLAPNHVSVPNRFFSPPHVQISPPACLFWPRPLVFRPALPICKHTSFERVHMGSVDAGSQDSK